ncbi:MAG: UDP-3-O-acyl-N-acetylglucosamine deacetylase [Gammaproteobacteria bacterium]|nr:UDP-3-O-acyl-N-acetylglucosamine deacetylase [Gammaproteobacteria bacterium]MDE0414158.1 UDP-3-O-acyl-N-acetylglucosamine deacetylase [Gammaproteobacteria bacterium]MDE0455596.1 UDP-3-O-acyl-N-acetylglucosamine deacetylase [Gammaproteobacteria bacterium]
MGDSIRQEFVRQRTLRGTVTVCGIGLHSGRKAQMTLRPAAPNNGVVFRRADVADAPDIPARYDFIVDTRLGTTLGSGNARVATVEHLLSALAGTGIDNAWVDLDGPEVPALDGSASAFVLLVEEAGVEQQETPRSYIRVLEEVRVEQGRHWAALLPGEGYSLSYRGDFAHPAFARGGQAHEFEFSAGGYIEQISRARTFGFLHEVAAMRRHGLALGGGLHNAVVFDDYRVVNEGGLRYANEPIRHKLLDAVGDLSLLGRPLIGRYRCFGSGHTLNARLMTELMQRSTAWEEVTGVSRAADASRRPEPAGRLDSLTGLT